MQVVSCARDLIRVSSRIIIYKCLRTPLSQDMQQEFLIQPQTHYAISTRTSAHRAANGIFGFVCGFLRTLLTSVLTSRVFQQTGVHLVLIVMLIIV